MKKIVAILALSLLASFSAQASEFRIFGSYADTDVLGSTGGGGIGFAFPLGDVVGLDLRATYLQELASDPLDGIFDFDDDNDVFSDSNINIVPIDVGLRFNLQRRGTVNPYLGAGGTYFILDSDRRGAELDDELGFYGVAGLRFGDAVGASFFAEAMYRRAEASVAFRDDDIDFDDKVSFDLDGFAVNAGVQWTF